MLAATIKAKYPQYANVPDAQLEQAVIAKYPQYGKFASPAPKSVGGFIGNIGKSGVQAVKDVGGGLLNVLNPNLEQNTVANIGRLIDDAGYAAAGNAAPDNRAVGLVNYYKDRYGKNLGDTLYNDPVGVLLDASTVLDGGGALLKAGKLAKAGEFAQKAGRIIDPLRVPGRVAGKVASKIPKNAFAKFGKTVSNAGDTMLTRGIGNPLKQAETAAKYGLSMEDYIKKYGVYDRSPETAKAVTEDLGSRYVDKATSSKNKLKVQGILDSIDKEISKIENGPEKFSDHGMAMAEELKRRKQQFIDSIGGDSVSTIYKDPLTGKIGTRPGPAEIGVKKVYEFRKGALDPDIPQSMFGLDAHGTGKATAAKTTRNIFRKFINSSDPELERLGMDFGASKQYQKILEKSAARGSNRQLFNFTKLGGAGIGGIAGGAPGAIGGFIAEQIINSPKFIEYASKALNNGGKAISKGKIPTIPNGFKKVASGAYKAGRLSRAVNPDQKKSTVIPTKIQPQTPLKKSYPTIVPQPIISSKVKVPKAVIPKSSVKLNSFKKLKKGSFY